MAYPTTAETLPTNHTNGQVIDPVFDNDQARILNAVQLQTIAGGTHSLPTHVAAADPHTGYQKESEKGVANGYAGLGAGALVPAAQLGTGTANSSTYLNGAGAYSTPSAGGGDLSAIATLAAAPTGTAATDSLVFSGAATNTTYLLRPGTYVINPTTLTAANMTFRGAPGRRTTVQLASQGGGVNVAALTLSASNLLFEDIIFDGNKANIQTAGDYWSGLIAITASRTDITFRRCTIQNTAKSGIYGAGTSGSGAIRRVIVEHCLFSTIGTNGADLGGACVMLEYNIHDCEIRFSRGVGMSSNFLKVKCDGSGLSGSGNAAIGNFVDYTANTSTDTNRGALGIEFWTGSEYSRCIGNTVIGPASLSSGFVWGISLDAAPYSTVMGNTVRKGGSSNTQMLYGIEIAQCPYTTVSGNTISGCQYGTNITNDTIPGHGTKIVGNIYSDIFESAVTTDSGPVGISILGNTFKDAGKRYISLSLFNTHSGPVEIANNTFLIENLATADDGGGNVYCVNAQSSLKTNTVDLNLHDNYSGPILGGTSAWGLRLVEMNNPQGLHAHHNTINGARPDTGAAHAVWAISVTGYGAKVHDNKARLCSGFFVADTSQVNEVYDNDVDTLTSTGLTPTAAAGANAGTSPPAPVVTAGSIPKRGSLTWGTGTTASPGAQAVVTFPFRFRTAPDIFLTAKNTATEALGLYVSSVSVSGFTVSTTGDPADSQANTFYSAGWLAMA